MILRKITNTPPFVFTCFYMLFDLKIKTIHEETKNFYKIFHTKLFSHLNLLIANLVTPTIPRNPPRRLK